MVFPQFFPPRSVAELPVVYSWSSHFLDWSSMFEIVLAVLVVPVAVHLFGSGTCHLFSLFLNE